LSACVGNSDVLIEPRRRDAGECARPAGYNDSAKARRIL